jgi:hypothetical protein
MKEVLQHRRVEGAQFLAEPRATRKRTLDIKAIRSGGIKLQMETQFDDELRVLEEKVSQLTGGDQAFLDAHEERFEGGTLRVRRASARRTLVLPSLEQGEQRVRASDHGIMSE